MHRIDMDVNMKYLPLAAQANYEWMNFFVPDPIRYSIE